MNLLEAQSVTVQMGQQKICQRLSLKLQPGEIWGILGPNGSGKTTLLHTLAGIHPITQGAILLREELLTSLTPKAIAQTLGILFQDFQAAFPQTVWEYCLAGRYPHLSYFKNEKTQDKEIAFQMLRKMNLTHLLERNIMQLSGGEKRRVAIAALLAQTPEIYLLDEPGNHLDVRNLISILHHFRWLAKTKSAAIIMSLHDINLAQQFCDRILLLFPDGETMQGKCDDVLRPENLTRLYQHPIGVIYHRDIAYWIPDFN